MTPLARFVQFHARPGEGEQLAQVLLEAAAAVGEAPGCEQWLVQAVDDDPDTICVSELWASREQCDAALEADGTADTIARVNELLAGAPELTGLRPLGGARVVTGTQGAHAVRILDSKDLAEAFGMSETGEARYVREELGTVGIGLSHYRMAPGKRQGFGHRHTSVEEIYVTVSGTGRIKVDDELIDLEPLGAVRVQPASVRELEAGPDGLEVLAFGTRIPGDGEMISGWWPADG